MAGEFDFEHEFDRDDEGIFGVTIFLPHGDSRDEQAFCVFAMILDWAKYSGRSEWSAFSKAAGDACEYLNEYGKEYGTKALPKPKE